MAKTYRQITVTAGALQKRILIPVVRGGTKEARAAKKKLSDPGLQARNGRHSWEKLEMQLAANYDTHDLWLTLTVADEAALTKKQRTALAKKFIAALRALRRSKKRELRCHWVWENDLGRGRWHLHIVLNSTGDDLDDIRSCWELGEFELEPLRVDGGEWTYERLARYMCKERDPDKKPGLHTWHHTRNIHYPEIEEILVEADETLQAPRGSVVLETVRKSNRFGRMEYLKLFFPHASASPRARRKKRRR